MKNKNKQIFAANGVAKEIGISAVRFYTYIRTNKIYPDYYHISNKENKFYYFSEDSVSAIKKWHSDFRKSKSNSLSSITKKFFKKNKQKGENK